MGGTLRAPGSHPARRPVHEVTTTVCVVRHSCYVCAAHSGMGALAYSWSAGDPCILRSSTAHRNVYRGTAKMFSQDAVALELIDRLQIEHKRELSAR